MVLAYDEYGNYSSNPTSTYARLRDQPIYLKGIYVGEVNSYYADNVYIQASFITLTVIDGEEDRTLDITSIEYMWSENGTDWHPFGADMLNYSEELYYNEWDNYWSRQIYVDLSGLPDGNYWEKATDTDEDGNTFDAVKQFKKDTDAGNVWELIAVPNEDNNAIVLTWESPEDINFAYVYRWDPNYYPSGRWVSLGSSTTDTYTDSNVITYKDYTYRVVVRDMFGNESISPTEVTGRLHTDDEIAFDSWYLANDGVITSSYHQSFTISAYFKAYKQIETIDFTYSANDGVDWLDLTPFMSSRVGVYNDINYSLGYRNITLNVSGPLGWPDGNYMIRAEATDSDGNMCTSEVQLLKDTTPPANVTNLTAELNDDQTAITLSWDNPAEDFKSVDIYRNTSIEIYRLESNTHTDTDIQPGSIYTYDVYTYDEYNNRSINPTSVTVVVDGGGPVLDRLIPADGSLTNVTSLAYRADFYDDTPITYMLFEYSEDGINWTPINPDSTMPSKSSYTLYYISSTFDVSWVTEKTIQIRVTARDEKDRTATATTSVTVDHVAPPAPSNFSATPDGNKITLTWDEMPDIKSYYLQREYQNPSDGSYSPTWNIYPPSHSVSDTSVYSEQPYRYRIRARDNADNYGPYTDWVYVELYNGPEIDFERGVSVFTNNSAYTLRGTTDPGAAVTVNGTAVSVAADGSFEYSATLSSSTTTFTVVATKGGVSHTKKQRVAYDTTAPTGYISYPSNEATVAGNVNITVSYSDSGGAGVERAVLQIELGENNWVDIVDFTGSTNLIWDSKLPVGGSVLSDGPYRFRLMVYDRAGNVITTPQVRLWNLDNTPPMIPTGIIAEAGTTQIEADRIMLRWNANTDIDTLATTDPYLIYRSRTPGSGYKYLAYSKTNTFTDGSVESGVTYYYVIAAKDKNGNISAFSDEAYAVPLADTTAPVLTVPSIEGMVYGSTSPNFNISATDNSPDGIKEFICAYSSDGGATWTEFARGRSTTSTTYYLNFTWTLDGLIEGAYQLRFSAVDFNGNRADVIRNVTVVKTMDDAPPLTATRGDGCIILTWDPVTHVDVIIWVMRSPYLTGGYTTIYSTTDETVTTYTDTSITLGEVYYYKLRIIDNYGNNVESNTVSQKAGDDITPPEVGSISLSDGAQSGGPSIQFNASASDNKAVTAMNAFYSLDDGASWVQMQFISRTGPTKSGDNYWTYFTWNTEGLASGVYKIKVTAADAAGNEGSMEVHWDLDFDVSKVQNLNATPGEGYIVLRWDAIPASEVNPFSSDTYQILYSTSFDGPFNKIGTYGAFTGSTTYTHTNLSPSDTHYYRIESKDKWGNKAQSDTLAARTLPDGTDPSINSVVPDEDSIIGGPITVPMSVHFTDNADPQKARITAEISTDGGYTWSPLPYEIHGPSLYSGSTYQFTWNWDLRPMLSAVYLIRYTVYDSSGNYDRKEVFTRWTVQTLTLRES